MSANDLRKKKQDLFSSPDGYDPFAERDNKLPTTDFETLTHLLKSALGTGILSMPIAFKYSGIIMGIFATMLTGLICGHCMYILVKCSHILYYRNHVSKMSFAELGEESFRMGPKCSRSLAPVAKFSILFGIFLTYFGSCAVYAVIVARNFEQILVQHMGSNYTLSLRMLILSMLIPLILLCWIPNLKYLAPVSLIANIFMFLGLGITIYYLVQEIPDIHTRDYVHFYTLPAFFSITIFAMEAIGIVMPLENNMETPPHFLGYFGVASQGMTALTLLDLTIGFLGYLRYGEDTEESITLNLPVDEWPAQAVKLLVALAVFGTIGLQFYVCLEICWDGIKEKCTKSPTLAYYTLRTVLITAAVALAIAVPTIAPFIGLIGAFCFSILGLIFPAIIETLICYEIGFGPCHWILWKNIFIVFFGVFALVFGSKSSLEDIAKLYYETDKESS